VSEAIALHRRQQSHFIVDAHDGEASGSDRVCNLRHGCRSHSAQLSFSPAQLRGSFCDANAILSFQRTSDRVRSKARKIALTFEHGLRFVRSSFNLFPHAAAREQKRGRLSM
jgi:hypothetical protein